MSENRCPLINTYWRNRVTKVVYQVTGFSQADPERVLLSRTDGPGHGSMAMEDFLDMSEQVEQAWVPVKK